MHSLSTFPDEIRRLVPISTIVGNRVRWDTRKTNASRGDWWSCCPFHEEKTASFHCDDKKGVYYCFSCGASGDHFRFLMDLEGIHFSQALEKIAAIAGLKVPVFKQTKHHEKKQFQDIYDVMERATYFFEKELHDIQGEKARNYLRMRGITAETQKLFRLGYASGRKDVLKNFLLSEGFSTALMESAGLIVCEENSVFYDRFRDRVIFPIQDHRERIVAFGGRALSRTSTAKYINSPETKIFQKKHLLYHFARAQKNVTKDKKMIVVEGYLDVISLYQEGWKHVVAPLGTSMTIDQLHALWRVCSMPVLCFDGDAAGIKAAARILDVALPMIDTNHSLSFALLPEGQDPDDLIRSQKKDLFESIIEKSLSFCDMLWIHETKSLSLETPERRAQFDKRFSERISLIKDSSLRFHYMQEFRVRIRSLFVAHSQNAFQSQKGVRGKNALLISENLKSSGLLTKIEVGHMPLREAVIIVTLVHHPLLVEEFFEQIEKIEFSHIGIAELFKVLKNAFVYRLASTQQDLHNAIVQEGLEKDWNLALTKVKKTRQWTSLEGAAFEEARQAFIQVLKLYQMGKNTKEELYAIGKVFAKDPTEKNYLCLVDMHAQIHDIQGADALIEGFGDLSGRTQKN